MKTHHLQIAFGGQLVPIQHISLTLNIGIAMEYYHLTLSFNIEMISFGG